MKFDFAEEEVRETITALSHWRAYLISRDRDDSKDKAVLDRLRVLAGTERDRIVNPTVKRRTQAMRRLILIVLVAVLSMEPMLMAVGSKNTEYVGGTVTSIKEGTEGKSSLASATEFQFEHKGGKLSVPYTSIQSLEYGQKAGRRVGLAIVISPIALFSKKRKHFLTISYTGPNGSGEAVIFELGKDVVRTTLATIQARTGKEIEYQDDEARKAGGGN